MPIPSRPRVVITGAGSGLGRAFCQVLSERGARLVASDVRLDAARETVALLRGGEAHALRCDVSKIEEVEALAARAQELLGGVDLVINNAGVALGGRVGEIALADWQWLIDINLWGVIYGCHVFVPILRRQGSGHVLNVASAAGLLCAPLMGPYNVAKAGVVALSETLYGELAKEGVGVTVLCPTFFQTNIAKNARGDRKLIGLVDKLMSQAKIDAAGVARCALTAAEAGELYAIPQADGRWFWRLKRALPGQFAALVPKIMALRTRFAPR